MARRIEFARSAEADLDRLAAFLATESRGRAERAVARIIVGVQNLADFPELGVAVGGGFRQLVLRYGKSGYVVRYRVLEDVVLITAIWHGREDR
jgi:plasmid stabilization system protein ParE